MNKDTEKILQRIKLLEGEKTKLLNLRKEEIFNVLQLSGGLALDNRLLSGLAIYAANFANYKSDFLEELRNLGQSKAPSRKNRNIVKTTNQDANT